MFDLLYLNGTSLLHRSLKFRKRNLRACLREVPGRIELVSEREGKTAKDVRLRMEEIMAERGEGLVLKHPDSEYVLNGRNKDWIKVSHLMNSGGVLTGMWNRLNRNTWSVPTFTWLVSDSEGRVGQHGRNGRRARRCRQLRHR